MKLIPYIFFIFSGILILCFPHKGFSSHIRAGDLTGKRINRGILTYEFTVILFRDNEGVRAKKGSFDFGDQSQPIEVDPISLNFINDMTTEVLMYKVVHTFPSAGKYKVSYFEENRNYGVKNIFQSGETAFYIESEFLISPILGMNSSPVLLIPPVDIASINQKFEHHPGSYDADGDSLSYRLTVPKRSKNEEVINYTYLYSSLWTEKKEDQSIPGTFTINPVTGLITWDAPKSVGEYNISIIVDEWRDGILIGSVNRDMQIIVKDFTFLNKRPFLNGINQLCLVAGEKVDTALEGKDDDGDFISLSGLGELFQVNQVTHLPVLSSNRLQPPNGVEKWNFQWETHCGDIRKEPYYAIFKINDGVKRNQQLIDFHVLGIQVLGPKPENIKAVFDEQESTMNLLKVQVSWDEYSCSNAEKMEIYRYSASNNYIPQDCETGIREDSGYKKVGEVDISETAFEDLLTEGGKTYCYRIYAVFQKNGKSVLSDEVCVFVPNSSPYITKVSVKQTDASQGSIELKWTRPMDIDKQKFPPPYSYGLLRSKGDERNYEIMATLNNEEEMTFLDEGLDTQNFPYNYKIILYSGNVSVDTSAVASSVWLSVTSLVQRLQLQWEMEVPWINNAATYPFHDVYRAINTSESILLSEVDVFRGNFLYLDREKPPGIPLEEADTYCYRVLTRGMYLRKDIEVPLENWSQIVCTSPKKLLPCKIKDISISKCSVIDSPLDSKTDCKNHSFDTNISWTLDVQPECSTDIKQYEIYYSERENEEKKIVGYSQTPSFTNRNLSNIAGCYAVVSVGANGEKSQISSSSCIDSCPYYDLPNIFTPDDDDSPNNFYHSFPCPSFVEKVNLLIVDRWGQIIFEKEGDAFLSWDGKNQNGEFVPAGIYFYHAKIKTKRLNIEDELEEKKGWFSIIRKK